MRSIKQTIRNILQSRTSRILKDIIPLNVKTLIGEQLDCGITFDGWYMKTWQELPWNGGIGNEHFLCAAQDIKQFEFSGEGKIYLSNIDELLWRHWVVSYCVRHAIEFIDEDIDMVECGVCDGVTAFFALRELKGHNSCAKMHLYDAWSHMRGDLLLESEKSHEGDYSKLTIQRTKRNLSEFDNVVYHQGYIPESLHKEPDPPEKISYLSIDLNSSIPTVAALEFFFPRLVRGGVILFDDYGWIGYGDTKRAVDKFFKNKPGILMPLPTGQAIYYR